MPPRAIIWRLELEVGPPPPAGRLVGPDGTRHEFEGWIGLATALRDALGPPEQVSGTASEGDPG